eukprot:Seg4519.3 transcript_id=Seg4519.3/GoldUCD/mRNA.D3Y31 product="Acid-sensing ion channel 4-A" protein_id=Seg4519.3/GoldUCD/D3Y31
MDELTIHGFGKIFTHKKVFGRVIWAIIFLSSCAFLFLQLFALLQKFARRDFVTKIEIERTQELDFPTITICDSDKDHAPVVKNFSGQCLPDQSRNEDLFDYGCKFFLAGMKDACVFDSFRKCRFPDDFTPALNPSYCYSMNKNGSFRQKGNDRMYGLEMLMFKNSSEFKAVDNDGMHPLRWTQQKRGLFLKVHAPSVNIGLSLDEVIPLASGYHTEIALKKKIYARLKHPYPTKCSSFSSVKNIFRGNYTVKNCLISCILHAMYRECGNVLPHFWRYMPPEEYPRWQSLSKAIPCLQGVYNESSKLECDCPQPCYEEKYETKVTISPLIHSHFTPNLMKQLGKRLNIPENVTMESFKPHIARLSVFYESFVTEKHIEQELYDVESLLSDFGGLMGLLVGASVISLVELIWLIVTAIFNRVTGNGTQVDTRSE